MKSISHGPTSPPNSVKLSRWGHVTLFHVIVVLLSIVMTVSAWLYSKYQVDHRTSARFEVARDAVIGLLKDGMQKYEDALWAGVSTMQSHGTSMTLQEWRTFSSTLRIGKKHPGINGIGVIRFLAPDDVPEFLAERRAERANFDIFPPHTQDIFMPITFIEPEETNSEALGLDVAHELNRRTAALASRDTGTARISGPITLVQFNRPDTPGFLFFAPFYEGAIPSTEAERKEQAIGLVYAPFVVHKLMAGLLAKELREVRFSIADSGEKIYDEHSTDDALNDPDPMHRETISINLYGRDWTLDLRTNRSFRVSNTYTQPTFVLLGGLIIEALIVSMLVMMSRASILTHAYADKVTADLRVEKHKLATINEELSQFAYVASHDLKTPIRGIGGLTEMLLEDLEDYLASPDAEPEVVQHLDRIDARVARMSELTRGILEYSRVGTDKTAPENMDLSEVIDSMIEDFDLAPAQIKLNSAVTHISTDSFNLRRVLENLTSNAIKYHEGDAPLQIDINVTRMPQRLLIEFTDNGPGIDPQFHERVFEVFQTLREAGAPESTGIGLSIVKKLVERLGGAITIVSEPGHGASFRFDWPMNAAASDSSKLGKAA